MADGMADAMADAMAQAQPSRWRRHRRTLALALLLVLAVHAWLLNDLAQDRLAWGKGDAPPPRIEVAFVKELAPVEPVAAPPPAAKPKAVAMAAVVARAASASASAASAAQAAEQRARQAQRQAEQDAELAAAAQAQSLAASARAELQAERAEQALRRAEVALAALDPPPLSPASASATPATAAQAVAAAAAAPPRPSASAAATSAGAPLPHLGWPPSTRLSFLLKGNYRGDFEGTAQVDWLLDGPRYQVHLETSVGPLLSRHITSEGELGPQGLVPLRFVGEQKVMLRSPKRWRLSFGPDRVVLADGKTAALLPGTQDEASQFVQLTWLFTQQPELLKVGGSVDMPLAINRKLETWTYRVVAEQTLRLGFGDLPTFHLKPSREASGGDMAAEIWIAPSLQYLPVRILIRQDAQTWVDLVLEKPPLQAAAAPQTR